MSIIDLIEALSLKEGLMIEVVDTKRPTMTKMIFTALEEEAEQREKKSLTVIIDMAHPLKNLRI
jgi:hypothetical protein